MSIRVGRIKYVKGHQRELPAREGYTPIVCLTAASPYGSLSPYELRDEKGRCIENLWQFAKIYETVPEIKRVQSRIDATVVWQYPAEQHVLNEQILPTYWTWRKKGMETIPPIRYPVGYDNARRGSCLGALWHHERDPTEPFPATINDALGYIAARKAIYVPLYEKLVRDCNQFKELVARRKTGENLLILEVDGPHEESMPYYKERYQVPDDFIVGDTIAANDANLDILLNDEKHPYGHGYCLAKALLQADRNQ